METREYSITDQSGNSISEIKTFDYNMKNFDWVLIADVETSPEHRGKGYASKLINEAYKDVVDNNPNKGLYLFVKESNENAIKLYNQLGFENLKSYTLNNGKYFIMAKGNTNKDQFRNMNFS